MNRAGSFLEIEFQGELANPRRLGARNLCKVGRRHDSTRSQKLGVIADVIELRPELEIEALRQKGIFQERHIPVVDAGAVEESAIGISFRADGR